jgi:hypothetical protein
MARSPGMVRLRKYKMKQRKTAPKAFSQKALSGLNAKSKSGKTRFDVPEFDYSKRGGGNAEYQVKRLEHFIKTHKPHHRILYWLFNPAIRHASEQVFPQPTQEVIFEGVRKFHRTKSGYGYSTIEERPQPVREDMHPKIAVEQLIDILQQQDGELKVFAFESVHLEKSPNHDVWLYFRGRECFGVYRKFREVWVTVMYSDITRLKDALWRRTATWAGEPFKLDHNSLADLET